MKKLIVCILMIFVGCLTLKAQQPTSDTLVDSIHMDNSSHQIGLSASLSQGIGISYKKWYEKRLGFQGSILPIVIDDVHLFLGGSLLCRFALQKRSFPFINAGAVMYHSRYGGSNISNSAVISIGAGYEFNIKDIISISLKLDGIIAYFDSDRYPSFLPISFPLPGATIMYQF